MYREQERKPVVTPRPFLSLQSFNNNQDKGTMSDIQALLAALDVFTRAPDKTLLEKANTWLQDFQHSVNTLSPVAHRLRPLTRHHPPVLIVSSVDDLQPYSTIARYTSCGQAICSANIKGQGQLPLHPSLRCDLTLRSGYV